MKSCHKMSNRETMDTNESLSENGVAKESGCLCNSKPHREELSEQECRRKSSQYICQWKLEWEDLNTVGQVKAENAFIWWLETNYKVDASVVLNFSSFLEHFNIWCRLMGLVTAPKEHIKKVIFDIFPNVKICIDGDKGEVIYGLDICSQDPGSENVKLCRQTVMFERERNEKEKEDTNDLAIETDSFLNKLEKKTSDSWQKLSSEEKDIHKENIPHWLNNEYEISPSTCLLRQRVHEHYKRHCDVIKICAAPTAIFGKILQKTFVNMTMRRLGQRGDSKYYYMGIDIREESTSYKKLASERIICNKGKPKISRVFNGKRKSRHT